MKKIFILLSALFATFAIQAQSVSTSPANKKAILEEFTGQRVNTVQMVTKLEMI